MLFVSFNLGLFDTIGHGKEESVRFYNNWVKHVKKTVPPNRLLVFEAKQGWEPLCQFLDLPTPEGKFPHVNNTRAHLQNLRRLKILSYLVVWGIPIIVAIIWGVTVYS